VLRNLALALLVAVWLVPLPAHASTALELVQLARGHELGGHEETALRRYMDALSLDPTCAEAYLGLGALRTRRGDVREAERVYDVALEHIPGLTAARLARARVRRALGARSEAVDDLLAAGGADGEPSVLRLLAQWYGEDGQGPAQLAVWRRMAARAEATNDEPLLHESRTMIRALVLLVGPADPVAAPADEDNPVRRAIGAAARFSPRTRRGASAGPR